MNAESSRAIHFSSYVVGRYLIFALKGLAIADSLTGEVKEDTMAGVLSDEEEDPNSTCSPRNPLQT